MMTTKKQNFQHLLLHCRVFIRLSTAYQHSNTLHNSICSWYNTGGVSDPTTYHTGNGHPVCACTCMYVYVIYDNVGYQSVYFEVMSVSQYSGFYAFIKAVTLCSKLCLTSLLTLTPWSKILLEKLTCFWLVKKFPTFYGIWRFITAFTSARHLPFPQPVRFSPYPTIPLPSILILSSHLCLGLPSGLFLSGFPTKTLYTPLLSPIRATCPAHLILLDFITWTILGEEYNSLNSSLSSFLHSCYLIPLMPKYSQPILKHPQPTFLPQYEWPSFTPI